MTSFIQLQELELSLRKFERGEINVSALCQLWRAQDDLLGALPDRYRVVLEDVLGRLESSALFTDESCSFSVADMRGSLGTWLQKARAQLDAQERAP